MQTMFPSSENDLIKFIKLEFSLHGFNILPTYTSKEGIIICILHFLPDCIHIVG